MKILLFDIETSPLISYTWGTFDQNVIKVKNEWTLLSFAFKWLGEKEVTCYTRKGEKSDKHLTRKLWAIMDKADLIIAHNGDAFDIKKAQAKFLEHKLPPTRPFKTLDTLKVARQRFKLTSNRLDDLGELLGLGRKLHTGGFDLWLGCMADKPESWKIMAKYNKQDVVLLEKVYLELRPWAKTHIAIHRGASGKCPRCDQKLSMLAKRCFACNGNIIANKAGVLKSA